jgi:hypothetical protein
MVGFRKADPEHARVDTEPPASASLGIRATCVSSASLLKGIEMALAKKKRVGKRTISAKQVRKTASGRKRHKSDGTQPPKAVTPTLTPAAS